MTPSTPSGRRLLDAMTTPVMGFGPREALAEDILAIEREAVEAYRLSRETPPDLEGLLEDVGHLADAAKHLSDHVTESKFYCEDTDNVQHFVVKVRAALHPDPRQPDTQEAEKP